MGLFGGCSGYGGNDNNWIWIVIIVIFVICSCGDGNLFGSNNCCDPCRDEHQCC